MRKSKLSRIAILLAVVLSLQNGFAQDINTNTTTDEPTLVAELTGHTDTVTSVSFSPDGNILASEDWQGIVILWDAQTGNHLHTLEGLTWGYKSIAFSPDGSILMANEDWEDTVILWDAQTGNHLHTFEGHTDDVRSVSFSPDGSILASASYDTTVRLWDTQTGELLHTLEGHSNRVFGVAFSPDGLTLTSWGLDGVTLWDVDTGEAKAVLEHTGWVVSVAFSPDGLTLAIVDDDDVVTLWDVGTGELKTTIWLNDYATLFISVAFSPDGGMLAVGLVLAAISDFSGVLMVFDVETGEEKANFAVRDEWLLYANGIDGLVFSPDGSILASANSDGTVILWDAQTGDLLHKLEGHTQSVTSVSFSPDGRQLASGSWDNGVFLWDVSSMLPIAPTAVEPRGKRLTTLGDIKRTPNPNK